MPTFPIIKTLQDIIPHIEGRNEFVVAKKDGYTVISYVVMEPDTFGLPDHPSHWYRRECRGIKFDNNTGKIICRPLHKFFNIGENGYTLPEHIDLAKPHRILTKLDGSMICPFKVNGAIRWGTKMGITDTAMNAEVFVARHPEYTKFVTAFLESNFTPIFEWCSRKNRIVLDYPEDNLVLVAARHMVTGEYISYNSLLDYMTELPVVNAYFPGTINLTKLIEETKEKEDAEGYVIRFTDGNMYKIKSDWYLRLHRAKEALSSERRLVDAIIHEQIDDVVANASPEDKVRIEEYQTHFFNEVDQYVLSLQQYRHSIVSRMDRKKFALTLAPDIHPIVRALIFKMWDDQKDCRNLVINTIEKNVHKQQKFEGVKALIFPNVVWNNNNEEENDNDG